MAKKMTQQRWEDTKKLQHIASDAELFEFLLDYQPTRVVQFTPNELRFLKRVLKQYEPDYDEGLILEDIKHKIAMAQEPGPLIASAE